MNEIKDQIRGGIDFEETVIGVLADDIMQLEELKSLSLEAKKSIISLLTVMKSDSVRHESILQSIIKKY